MKNDHDEMYFYDNLFQIKNVLMDKDQFKRYTELYKRGKISSFEYSHQFFLQNNSSQFWQMCINHDFRVLIQRLLRFLQIRGQTD